MASFQCAASVAVPNKDQVLPIPGVVGGEDASKSRGCGTCSCGPSRPTWLYRRGRGQVRAEFGWIYGMGRREREKKKRRRKDLSYLTPLDVGRNTGGISTESG